MMNKPLSLMFAILAFIFVVAAGVVISEYVFHLPMLLLPMVSNLAYFVLGGVAVLGIIFLYLKKVPRRNIHVGIIIGLLVLPYAQFLFGYMDVFVKDEAMIAGLRAEEVRISLTVEFHKIDTTEWVTVLDDVKLALYPGENYVHLGTISLPEGKYDQLRATVDIEADLRQNLQIAIPEINETNINDVRIKAEISSDIVGEGLELKNYKRDGTILYFTIAGTKIEEESVNIDYPGFGGPDLYLHIILDEKGKPSKIDKVLKFPPGVEELIGTKPIVGPAGCKTPGECKAYCLQPENYEECTRWCEENPGLCEREEK